MRTETEIKCPLCAITATHIPVDRESRKTIHCSRCATFQINNAAMERLQGNYGNTRKGFSRLARETPAGKRLLILLDITQNGPVPAASYVPIDELPD